MKIAYVCPFWDPAVGGIKEVVKALAKEMIERGHEVYIFTSDWDKTKRIKRYKEIQDGIHIHRCFHIAKISNFATLWPSVLFKLIKGNFDIIHSHMYGHPHAFFSALASILTNRPHIHTTHAPWTPGGRSTIGELLYKYNWLSTIVLKKAAKIIAITPWEINEIEKRGGKNITAIPNGIENDFFKERKTSIRKELGIQPKENIILFVGRLDPVKALDILIEALNKELQKRKNTYLILVGPDAGMKNKIEELSKENEYIKRIGEVKLKDKLAEYYQSSNIFVLPSKREGFPIALLEAMASGLPLVTSDVCGLPLINKKGINGYTVPYGEKEKLKQAIFKILDDKKKRSEIGKHNREEAKQYSWDKIADQTEQVYKEAIRK